MENIRLHIVFSMILFACLTSNSHGLKTQSEALSRLYKNKLKTKTQIDTSPFSAIADFSEERIQSHKWLKNNDLITELPGQPPVNFSQYSGYVTVNPSTGRALFYYFVEADPEKSSEFPLLLWLNGGPGCSSLGLGAMEELGPFRVNSDGKSLYKNDNAWNLVANVLFLETPAGVGFSYSNTTTDYEKSGDKQTAIDNYVFLLKWLKRFPEYKDREFYIAGESYAGHYVPQLAQTILHHNKKSGRPIINLKGMIIGNAAINDDTDDLGMIEYFQTHALISKETLNQYLEYCYYSDNADDECDKAWDQIAEVFKDIDVYNIYAPLCHNSNLTEIPKKASVLNFDPCSDYYVYAYLNRPDVQKAFHANVTKLPYDWDSCSTVLKNWTDSPETVLPILHELMANGIRVSIYRSARLSSSPHIVRRLSNTSPHSCVAVSFSIVLPPPPPPAIVVASPFFGRTSNLGCVFGLAATRPLLPGWFTVAKHSGLKMADERVAWDIGGLNLKI
ncbi:serine carboxypeptidase [Striga asiatica]|uniref:Carboxypeptidase n=1 Tax=Striga asiatica TaxID=4170 RepID=A0A5A7QKV8_STRAF|nr:serine carboxypeptidase [Striga asiatica]